ncbi:hypothetical protein SAY87_009430 [Trapa incisa]|uniref:C2 domain-containing protein n=1 Tax=Trapa incisa TaxID=236973 RepID=A0AAN7PXX3_9MYRT|nr:hypothetical protein SAY87_009430 [Trapa incisa]
MADYRTLDINVKSAKDLKDVNLFTKMDVYVVVSISGDPFNYTQKTKTKVDRDGGKNPAWNFSMRFTINEPAAQQGHLNLIFKLRCDRILGDEDIGEVVVPIREILGSSTAADERSMKTVTYQVRKPSGKPKGELYFSYKFSDVVKAPEHPTPPVAAPVTAYPTREGPSSPSKNGPSAHPPAGYPPVEAFPAGYSAPPPPGYGYPPPQPAGYGYPPPYGGYPPPQPGYGYPPPPPPGYGPYQQPQKKNSGMGAGLGLGLLGGVVGGLLIGDMVSDAADFGDCGF